MDEQNATQCYTVEAYVRNELILENKPTAEVNHVSMILMWCHLSVWKTRQSSLTKTCNIFTMFSLKISTVPY